MDFVIEYYKNTSHCFQNADYFEYRQTRGLAFDISYPPDIMDKQLEEAGINLSNKEHLLRVKSYFDSAYIIQQSSQNIGLLKYIETELEIEIIQFQVLSI